MTDPQSRPTDPQGAPANPGLSWPPLPGQVPHEDVFSPVAAPVPVSADSTAGYPPVPGQPSLFDGPPASTAEYAPPSYAEPTPVDRRPTRARWLVPLLVLAVLVGAGATFGGIKLYNAITSASTVFSLPDSVDGMPKSPSPDADAITQRLRASLPSAKVVGGGYLNSSDPQRRVVLVGIETPISDPRAEVRGAFTGFASTAPGLGQSPIYPPGPQGGDMECASGSVGGGTIPLAMCVVADSNGMIFLLYYSATESHAADVTLAVRRQFEKG